MEATCIRCGCTDSHPCEGGCSWVWVNHVTGEGVCTSCSPIASVADGLLEVDDLEEEEAALAGIPEDVLGIGGQEERTDD